MKDRTNPITDDEVVAHQAGQILVGLGQLLNSLSDPPSSELKTGNVLVRVGSKLFTRSTHPEKIKARAA